MGRRPAKHSQLHSSARAPATNGPTTIAPNRYAADSDGRDPRVYPQPSRDDAYLARGHRADSCCRRLRERTRSGELRFRRHLRHRHSVGGARHAHRLHADQRRGRSIPVRTTASYGFRSDTRRKTLREGDGCAHAVWSYARRAWTARHRAIHERLGADHDRRQCRHAAYGVGDARGAHGAACLDDVQRDRTRSGDGIGPCGRRRAHAG